MSCFSSDLSWCHQIYLEQIDACPFQWTKLVKSHMHCSCIGACLDHSTVSPLSWEPTWTSAVLRKIVETKVSFWNIWMMLTQTQKRISKGKRWVTLWAGITYVRHNCPAPSYLMALTFLIQAPDQNGKIYFFLLTWDPSFWSPGK